MPVPEIQAPSVQPEAMPSPVVHEPPLGAFGGVNLGEGLSKIGAEIFGIGWTEYHKSAEAFAHQKEIEFQKQALDLRDKYRNMKNMDAIEAHDKFTAELEKMRLETGSALKSQYASGLYHNNSQRNARFVQESMDSHFESENHSYRKLQYAQGQEGDTRMVAAFAAEGRYDPKKIEDLVSGMKQRGLEWARDEGIEPKIAEQLATNETHKATDALFQMLLRGHKDPDLVQSELKKYTEKGMVDAATQERVQGAVSGSQVNKFVALTTAGFKRYNTVRGKDGNLTEDSEGFVPYKTVNDAIKNIPANDPKRKEKEAGLLEWWSREERAVELAGKQLREVVVGNGAVGKANDLDWQKFVSLHPLEAQVMSQKEAHWKYTQERHSQVKTRDLSGQALGATHVWLSQLTPDELQAISPAEMKAKLQDNFGGSVKAIDPRDEAKALDLLKKFQSGKLDPVERQFHQIAHEELAAAFKGNRAKVEAAMGMAFRFLDDKYAAAGGSGKITPRELRDALKLEARRQNGIAGTSWLGSIPLLTYQSPPRPGRGGLNLPPPGSIRVQRGSEFGWLPPGKSMPPGWSKVEAK